MIIIQSRQSLVPGMIIFSCVTIFSPFGFWGPSHPSACGFTLLRAKRVLSSVCIDDYPLPREKKKGLEFMAYLVAAWP